MYCPKTIPENDALSHPNGFLRWSRGGRGGWVGVRRSRSRGACHSRSEDTGGAGPNGVRRPPFPSTMATHPTRSAADVPPDHPRRHDPTPPDPADVPPGARCPPAHPTRRRGARPGPRPLRRSGPPGPDDPQRPTRRRDDPTRRTSRTSTRSTSAPSPPGPVQSSSHLDPLTPDTHTNGRPIATLESLDRSQGPQEPL